MKKSNVAKRGLQDANQLSSQPDKVGWIRKFCGRGIFREIWKNRFVMLKGDHLYIFEKEMKDDGKTHEVFDLAEYERSEELRKAKSRSKKNHSKFTLLRCRQPGNRTPNLVFLAVSPEEKESWINVLNAAIVRAKNRIFDEASTSSDGMLTLHEEDASSPEDEGDVWVKDFRVDLDKLSPGRRRSGTDVSKRRATPAEGRVKTGSLPRGSEMSWTPRPQHAEGQTQVQTQVHTTPAHARTPQPGKRAAFQARNRCASMDDALSRGDRRAGRKDQSQTAALAHSPTGHLQDLIAQRLLRTQELLAEIQEQDPPHWPRVDSAHARGMESPRLRHLRGADSPQSKGSGSPHSKTSDSPSLKGKDSPRSKAKDSPRVKGSKHSKSTNSPRGKVTDSPDSRAPHSPLVKNLDLTHLKGSDSPLSTTSSSPHSKGGGSPHLKGAEHLRAASSPHLRSGLRDSPLREGGMVAVGGSDWEVRRAAAERLLQEAIVSWREAKEVLEEVKQLQERQRKAEPGAAAMKQTTPSHDSKPKEP
ncbi:pleckstrin homology domain-containing family O member 1-A isoform X2 [Alosa sapidissima]|uniref:pleckstrin homology domain-containing family O member 1-A isoform X2 n=1 Tax=Alosa sapidissima TaxID=34773 RepID=UPI001C087CC3|nr:pleckstrin homology domain-containing family O member 1-A isoform X2 [Alosa sapidissima]